MNHDLTTITAVPDTIAATTERDAQPTTGQTRIEIFTDGSCIHNPGPGGYGIVTLRRDDNDTILRRRERSGFEAVPTTNIRMEMIAACVALESLGAPTGEPVTVFCDANLIPNTMNRDLANWKARGWKKADGKPPNNQDLWERLEAATQGRDVAFKWVRGHNGAEHNERADKLAYAAARKAEQVILFGAEG